MGRFALVPAVAVTDTCLSDKHLRILLALSIAPSDIDGWCWCSLEDLGKVAGDRANGTIQPMSPGEVKRLLDDLLAWGYVEAYTGRDGSRAYRMILDLPPDFLSSR